jgi:hypothetical protein
VAIEKKEDIDWRRNAFFGAFGFLYLGDSFQIIYATSTTFWCISHLPSMLFFNFMHS